MRFFHPYIFPALLQPNSNNKISILLLYSPLLILAGPTKLPKSTTHTHTFKIKQSRPQYYIAGISYCSKTSSVLEYTTVSSLLFVSRYQEAVGLAANLTLHIYRRDFDYIQLLQSRALLFLGATTTTTTSDVVQIKTIISG
jgi:hypothetical protein